MNMWSVTQLDDSQRGLIGRLACSDILSNHVARPEQRVCPQEQLCQHSSPPKLNDRLRGAGQTCRRREDTCRSGHTCRVDGKARLEAVHLHCIVHLGLIGLGLKLENHCPALVGANLSQLGGQRVTIQPGSLSREQRFRNLQVRDRSQILACNHHMTMDCSVYARACVRACGR